MKKGIVSIVMGSDSDLPVMQETANTLESLGIGYEFNISSAHRSPEKTRVYASGAKERGIKVIIAGAGGAAHLAGVIAAETILPVIAVPIDSTPLKGIDSFLSTLQMPSGVPVATMAIGKAGAKNAAILAAQILALNDPDISKRLSELKLKMKKDVEEKDRAIHGQKVKDGRAIKD
ncbi:MAG: 5-(carboxyamino)imidazole ribonucleotide mutase [Nitrospinae bacterium]|nr:5-(carboxyamino)imidazole ribonucleotide mutase [Nitrospinota bacterium]